MENVYGYHIPHGELFLYGDNLKKCIPYIDNAINSVEDICVYCSQHGLRIYYNPKRSIGGFFESFLINKLTKKYSVHSSWKEICKYLETTQ